MSFRAKPNLSNICSVMLRKENRPLLILSLAVVFGILLRIFLLLNLPFTNDEGAYLYDAKVLESFRIPAGDILTKSPLAILLFTVGVIFSNGSLFATRIVNLILGISIAIPLYVVAENIRRKSGIIAVAIWLISSGPVVLLTYGHTETAGIFFALACLALLFGAFGKQGKGMLICAVLSGVAFILAIGARKTNLALILPMGIMVIKYFKNNHNKSKIILGFILGIAFILTIWLGAITFLYGRIGLVEALGGGYWEITSQKILGSGNTNVWGVSPLETFKVLSRIATTYVLLFVSILPLFLYTMFSKAGKSLRSLLLIPFAWIILLVCLYFSWPTFLPDHAADFFAPLTIITATLISVLWDNWNKFTRYLFIFVFVVINIVSLFWVFQYPWTGMFAKESVRSMAEEINKLVPKGDSILTGAVMVPYTSGNNVFGDISHPLWYRYDFINSAKKSVFLPEWKDVSEEIRNGSTKWLLVEHLTDYAYLRGEENLIDDLDVNWDLVTTVSNDTGFRNNPLKLYRRKSDK